MVCTISPLDIPQEMESPILWQALTEAAGLTTPSDRVPFIVP